MFYYGEEPLRLELGELLVPRPWATLVLMRFVPLNAAPQFSRQAFRNSPHQFQ